MQHQNWTPSVISKKVHTNDKNLKQNALNEKDAHGVVKTGHKGNMDGRKLHKILESESFDVPQMTMEIRLAIIQARQKMDWKQKDLAMAIGVKEQVVSHYESGKAVPDNAVIGRMEQVMKTKLPRPPKKR